MAKQSWSYASKIGLFRAALFSYRLALELNPTYKKSFCNLGLALSELGRSNGATSNVRSRD